MTFTNCLFRTQLLGQIRASGFVKTKGSEDIRDLNSNSENWAVVKAAIVAGLYGNLAQVDRKNSCLRIVNGNSSPVSFTINFLYRMSTTCNCSPYIISNGP